MKMKLHSYWRSSASYRVRIALNLKELDYEIEPVSLIDDGGEHLTDQFGQLNPQHQVPVLIDGFRVLRQSMAIIEYLEEAYEGYQLLPAEMRARQRVRMLAQVVACDIHPLNNLRVLSYLTGPLQISDEARSAWVRHWIENGFRAIESLLEESPTTGSFCEGDEPTLADICLAPQVYNAIRFETPLKPYPTIRRIYANCMANEAFHLAAPDQQPDKPNR